MILLKIEQQNDFNDLFFHSSIHQNVTYPCDICNQKFKSLASVREHKMIVHEGKINNKCKICGKRYGRQGHLRRHIKKIHTNIKGSENIRSMMLKLDE